MSSLYSRVMESTARAAIDARDDKESENCTKGQLGTQWTRQRPGEKEPEPRMEERAASFSRSSGAGNECAPVEMKISHSSGNERLAAPMQRVSHRSLCQFHV